MFQYLIELDEIPYQARNDILTFNWLRFSNVSDHIPKNEEMER